MLFKADVLEAIAAGRVTRAYRRWTKPTVKAGGQLRTAIGVLDILSVEPIARSAVTAAAAKAAGAPDLASLLRSLDARAAGDLYEIRFKRAGADPRLALRAQSKLTAAERQAITAKLDNLDAASRAGPWTRATLSAIAAQPGRRAPDLAAGFGRETLAFKRDVRKLKELGLTESLEIGYRLSPRGRAFMKR